MDLKGKIVMKGEKKQHNVDAVRSYDRDIVSSTYRIGPLEKTVKYTQVALNHHQGII